jgi:endonuclease/exonuclease/phosphatase (EEP) superfamily protein YafD
MLFPAILAFLLAWGSMFLPKHSIEARITDTPIRILTFNLKGYNRRQDAIVELIREVNADIVALQELSHINSPHIEVELQDIYPYKALHQTDNVTQGQGILSRYPITDDTFWRYDFAANMLGHQRVEITLENNRSIVLYNVHPSHPAMQGSFFDPQYRSLEIAAILQDSSKESWPQLLLGDFNMPELSDDYAQIRSHYKDAYRDSGFGMGWTFPDGGFISPFMRLDYIFYSDDFVAQHAQVWKSSAGSDHRPLFVDILLLNS